MRQKLLRFGKGFRVAFGNSRAQAAEMVISAGDREGGPDNRHRGADQWLYVASGTGVAVVNGGRVELREGRLLLIHHGVDGVGIERFGSRRNRVHDYARNRLAAFVRRRDV